MKTLTVANQKGGVGKTTLVVHLAHHAAEQGLRVLVVDLDSQRNASSSLQTYALPQLQSQMLFGEAPIAWPVTAMEPHIDLLEGGAKLVEIDRAPVQVINAFLKNMASAPGSYDLCLIDTPPVPGLRTQAALIFADAAVAPIDLDQYALDGIKSLLQTVTGIKSKYNAKLDFLGMLPSRFNTHSPAQRRGLTDLLAGYPKFVLPAAIALRSSIGEAAAERLPVWKIGKTAAKEAGKEIRQALDLILNRMGVSHGA
ncbi:MAG: ParA family protein [Nitrospira sp.]|nr:ParA family protein [Nitrospira sp.]MBS0194349.1 ParA family protein [Pseudomonadota bacterium]